MGQPALIGGLVMGVLSSLPLISAGNLCCCCGWSREARSLRICCSRIKRQPITPGDGALVGLFAGIIGAGVGFVISIPIGLMMEPMQRAMMQRTLDNVREHAARRQ